GARRQAQFLGDAPAGARGTIGVLEGKEDRYWAAFGSLHHPVVDRKAPPKVLTTHRTDGLVQARQQRAAPVEPQHIRPDVGDISVRPDKINERRQSPSLIGAGKPSARVPWSAVGAARE